MRLALALDFRSNGRRPRPPTIASSPSNLMSGPSAFCSLNSSLMDEYHILVCSYQFCTKYHFTTCLNADLQFDYCYKLSVCGSREEKDRNQSHPHLMARENKKIVIVYKFMCYFKAIHINKTGSKLIDLNPLTQYWLNGANGCACVEYFHPALNY